MTTIYATNLRCGKCLAVVAPLLDAEPSIQDWSVDLKHHSKLLTVEFAEESSQSVPPQLFQQAGYEATALETEDKLASETVGEDSGFSWKRYLPLILVVFYIGSLTAYCESLEESFEFGRAMSRFMGFFFLGFAFFKLLDVPRFADAFATYDVVAVRSRAYALAYPFIELTLGLLFLFRVFPLFANAATIVIMAVGLIGVVRAVIAKQEIQCACLGTAFNLPMSSVTIIENSVMILMAAAMLVNQLMIVA